MSNRHKAPAPKPTRAKTKPAIKLEQDATAILTSDEAGQAMTPNVTHVSDHPLQTDGTTDGTEVERLEPDSLAARWLLEKRSVIRELHHAYVTQVIFYTKPEGGNFSMDDAIKKASGRTDGDFDVSAWYDKLVKQPPSSISWYQIEKLVRHDPAAAQVIWEEIKEAADADFKSGHMAAEILREVGLAAIPLEARPLHRHPGFLR